MLHLILVIAVAMCAFGAVRAARLLASILWLAASSVVLSALLYALGAKEIAVIELSVGAGLVTVLLVVAVSIAGEDVSSLRAVVPHWLAALVPLGALAVLAMLILPQPAVPVDSSDLPFALMLWESRVADVLLQVALIFTGLLTVLGLLAESRAAAPGDAAAASDEETADHEEEVPV